MRGWPPQVAGIDAGAGISMASLRRFWAVAARWNSSRAVWPAQSQPIELQDAFQMREQHLDLFALTARGPVHLGLGDVARHIAGALVDGARDLASGRVRTALRLE